MDRSKTIFGNEVAGRVYNKAVKSRKKYIRKFGDDSQTVYQLGVEENQVLSPYIGVKNIVTGPGQEQLNQDQGMIIGNIRMGYGHYRISMAIASAANALGYIPYWFDLHAYQETTGGKIIAHLNSLYSLGSRWSQKYALFNKFYWEPLNSEGFKKLSYNAMDQKVAELMAPVYKELPEDLPFVGTHVWPAQAAVHAGMKRVVNVIPDNWPMALHLAEGSIHTVQTPSSFFGYKTLKDMDKKKVLKPIPDGEIFEVGHYIDHELVANLEADGEKRMQRITDRKGKRILITVGGAGAQKDIFVKLISKIIPLTKENKAVLYLNVGDHLNVWEEICADIPELKSLSKLYHNDWAGTQALAREALDGEVSGIHAFYHEDIFEAVYSTNLLMRSADILITKPSELAFYPVPKLLIKRVGGHEAWGAVRAAEIGDGTVECETVNKALGMLDLMLNSTEMLSMMVEYINRANKIGIYNGAYRVVDLAAGKTGH